MLLQDIQVRLSAYQVELEKMMDSLERGEVYGNDARTIRAEEQAKLHFHLKHLVEGLQKTRNYFQSKEKRAQYLDTETILEDNYPVYLDYFYLADGKVIRSDVQGTVRDLKQDTGAHEIRSCDIVRRGMCR